MKIGDYESRIVKKGFEETALTVKEGEEYFVVQLDRYGQIDVLTQTEAVILSKLIKIEGMLIKNEKIM